MTHSLLRWASILLRQPLYVYCLPLFEVTQFHFSGCLQELYFILWLFMPFLLKLYLRIMLCQSTVLFTGLNKTWILQPGFGYPWLCQGCYLPRFYLYDFLNGHLILIWKNSKAPSTPTVSVWKICYSSRKVDSTDFGCVRIQL